MRFLVTTWMYLVCGASGATEFADWTEALGSDRAPTVVEADFDGDGLNERATFSESPDRTKWALLIHHAGGIEEIIREAGEFPTDLFGLRAAKPGTYMTACGKGYFECGPDEPESITLINHAVAYFRVESSSALVFFDLDERAYRLIWSSD